MRGADKLIELRKSGRKPAMVFLNDYPTRAEFLDGTTVDISGDELNGLDLRFLVGLRVSTGSASESRAKAILEACRGVGAVMVATCHLPNHRKDQKTTDYMEIWNAANPSR